MHSFYRRCQSQRLDYGVVHGGTHGRDFVVVARGIDAIGQQDNEQLAIRIDPDGSAGETQMAEAAW